nr:sodium/glutamate symporter [uncultured Halomonas sp.]
MSVAELFIALLIIGMILLLSAITRAHVRWMRAIFLPSSVIGGVLALLAGPAVLGAIVGSPFENGKGIFPDYIYNSWLEMPGLLISVVFAALFLGKPLPGLREIWMRAGPQVVVGQTMAWGQYVVGLSLALLVLTPVFGVNPMVGALIEMGFEGGHGTAAGMAGTFTDLGFEEGADLALGMATIGIVAGVLIGTLLINIAARRGILTSLEQDSSQSKSDEPSADQIETFKQDLEHESSATDPLSFHLGLVGVAIVIGWLILKALQWIEDVTWASGGGIEIMEHVPLFPIAMIGGVIMQLIVMRCGWERHISARTMSRISGTALDYTIVAALATLSLTTLGEYLVPFLLLAMTGIAWVLFVLLVIAPRIIPENWFERGIGDMGQSMGVTVTGILLMRVADPKNESGAMESFGYKQLMFEPVVGGGLFTAAALPLIAQFGPLTVLGLTAALTLGWLAFGFLYFNRLVPERGRGRLNPKAKRR